VRVTALGDLILDVIVRLNGPLVVGDDSVAETRAGPGGQAANVAAWAAALGAEARFVGKRGDDAAGVVVARELAARGVDVSGPAGGRNGVVVSIAASGDRTMASDRGVASQLRSEELDAAWFECDVLHVSGYSLAREPIASAALRAVELARAAGASVSVDVSAWTLVDAGFRSRVRALAPDTVFANERERDAVGEVEAEWVVKRGADGVVVAGESFPSLATDVVDTTGAGDALAAGYLVGGIERGLEAAARCCAQLGAMP
jgi:sugar/nucleoside kinase (ribokinase family)